MHELKQRKENCRRNSAQQTEQATNCVQKSQRLRCCGRVISEQEAGDILLIHDQGKHMKNCQGQEKNAANRQGRRKRMGNCQGHGKGKANQQDQGRHIANRQGKCMA